MGFKYLLKEVRFALRNAKHIGISEIIIDNGRPKTEYPVAMQAAAGGMPTAKYALIQREKSYEGLLNIID